MLFDFLQQPLDAKPYVEVIRRMGKLFAFASLLPVFSRLRFADLSRRQAERKLKAEGQNGEVNADKKEKKDAAAEKPEQVMPLGFISAFLLALSELSVCYELFIPSAKKKVASHPVHKLVESVKAAAAKHIDDGSGLKRKKQRGVVDTAAGFVTEILADDSNFATVHSLLLLGGLTLTVALLFQWSLSKKGVKSTFKGAFGSGLLVAVACLFLGGHREILKKAWKALNEYMPGAFYLPLRVLALIFASRPRDFDSEDGTPPLFAGLQIASLVAYISAELVTDEMGVVTGVHKFLHFKELKYLIDNPAIATVGPLCFCVGWLLYWHVANTTGALFISILGCTVVSPVFLALGWPQLAAAIGVAAKSRGPALLLDGVSVAHSVAVVFAVILGGAPSIIAIFMVAHLLIGTHGLDSFGLGAIAGEAFSGRGGKTR